MRLTAAFQRIGGMIKSLANPPFFIYRIYHYANKYIPLGLASSIFKHNRKEYEKSGIKDVLIETHDGSGQSVHPTMAYWNNFYWLAITPYPYGMEEYENPGIYSCKTLDAFKIHTPYIKKQECHKQGTHLSDPALVVFDERLYCFFRSTENRKKNTLLYSVYDDTEDSWGIPKYLFESSDDLLLSPAFVKGSSLIMFHADWREGKGHLFKTIVGQDAVLGEKKEVIIKGLEPGLSIWHLDIISINCTRELQGLFLMRNEKKRGIRHRLYYANSFDEGETWAIVKECYYPETVIKEMKFPYKSCFIPGESKIILSFRDKKDRNRLTIVDL